MNTFLEILCVTGALTILTLMLIVIDKVSEKIKYWRAYKTKNKCLCKPHVYRLDWSWDDKKYEFECIKCGKKKKMYIDRKSFEDWFGKGEKNE